MPRVTSTNITRVYLSASAQDVASGRDWYKRAQDVARELDPDDVSRAAAVLAVLSPSTPWARNVALARQAYAMADAGASFDEICAPGKRGGLGTMGANARKAAAIVLGAEPSAVVSGPKVTPFWHRVADAAMGAVGPGSVVVDRHAFDVAVGRVTDDRTRGAYLGRKGGHARVQAAYVRAAAALTAAGDPITPAELQAVTWTAWRRTAHRQAQAQARRDDAV